MSECQELWRSTDDHRGNLQIGANRDRNTGFYEPRSEETPCRKILWEGDHPGSDI
jgi:hypothetical protein